MKCLVETIHVTDKLGNTGVARRIGIMCEGMTCTKMAQTGYIDGIFGHGSDFSCFVRSVKYFEPLLKNYHAPWN
jgi:hypothetical protein